MRRQQSPPDKRRENLKILMINKFLWPNGGAEIYMQKLTAELEKRGHVINFFGMANDKNTMLNKEGIYVTESDFHSKKLQNYLSYAKSVIYSAEAKEKLKLVIEDFRPDIIHLNNFNFQLTPSILDAIPDDIPVIMTAHDSQLICPNHLMYIPSKGTTCQRCLNSKTTFSCIRNRCTHGSLPKSIFSAVEGQVYRIAKTYQKIDLILCPSRFMFDIYKKDKRFSDKTMCLPNFVSKIEPLTDAVRQNYILYFGRLSPEKGIDNIMKAAKALTNFEFRIAGSGTVDTIDIPKNVKMLGRLEGEELTRTVQEASLVIAPSICYENNPLAVIEAQQLGCAVLVPGYGGAMELTDGPWIKDETAASLIKAISKAYCNENILNDMREDSKRRAPKYMDVEEYTETIEGLYKKLLKDKKGSA